MCSFGYVDRAIEAMFVFVAFSVVRLELSNGSGCESQRVEVSTYLLQKRQHLISTPSRRLPRIKIRTLRSRIHKPIHRRASTQSTSRRNNRRSISEIRGFPCLPEEHVLGLGEEVAWVEGWVDDFFVAVVVGSLFYE